MGCNCDCCIVSFQRLSGEGLARGTSSTLYSLPFSYSLCEGLALVTKMYDDLLARVRTAAPSLSRQVGLLKTTKCKQRGGKKAGPAGKGKGRQQKKLCPAKDVFLNAETVNPLNVPSDLMNFNC